MNSFVGRFPFPGRQVECVVGTAACGDAAELGRRADEFVCWCWECCTGFFSVSRKFSSVARWILTWIFGPAENATMTGSEIHCYTWEIELLGYVDGIFLDSRRVIYVAC